MDILFVGPADVRRLLPMEECIGVVAGALTALANGDAVQPLRTLMWLPGRNSLLGMMPAQVGGEVGLHGIKAVSVFPRNHDHGVNAHQGLVLLYESEYGRPIAAVDANELTAIRTAAASAVATRLLANDSAKRLAILGAGTQGRTHLDAMRAVRPIEQVSVWSRTPDHARALVERARELGVAAEATSADDAVEHSDIICTTTMAREPILRGATLRPGTHINAVGSCTPVARELDTEAVVRSALFCDRRESLVNEAGDFLGPRSDGAITDEHIKGEIGDVLIGKVEGRTSPDQITLFKSLGIGVEDVAAAHWVYTRARAEGAGTNVDFGDVE